MSTDKGTAMPIRRGDRPRRYDLTVIGSNGALYLPDLTKAQARELLGDDSDNWRGERGPQGPKGMAPLCEQ